MVHTVQSVSRIVAARTTEVPVQIVGAVLERSGAAAPFAWACVSGAARVTPVPSAPAVPTLWIVPNS